MKDEAREDCVGCLDEYDACKDCSKAWRKIAKMKKTEICYEYKNMTGGEYDRNSQKTYN